MNDEDDYYDGDMSDSEYRERLRRERAREEYYAQIRQKEKQRKPSVYYSPSEDEDSGSMW